MLQDLRTIELEQHRLLFRAGEQIDEVYLLDSALVSLFAIAEDGRGVETAIVGPGDFVGLHVILPPRRIETQAVVTVAGVARRIPTSQFLHLIESSPSARERALRAIASLLLQVEQNALCHALHSTEGRFCRWLLQAADTLDIDALEITQGLVAKLLGTQRTTISTVAHMLQCTGAIRTVRGKIQLVDRAELTNRACGCYARLEPYSASPQQSAGREHSETAVVTKV
jgi:CRP-like cAMP-binding protein